MKQLQFSKSNIVKIAIAILLLLFITINIDYSYNHRTYNIIPFKANPKIEFIKKEGIISYYKVTNTCWNKSGSLHQQSNLSFYTKVVSSRYDSRLLIVTHSNTPINPDVITIEKITDIPLKIWFSCNIIDFPINRSNYVL